MERPLPQPDPGTEFFWEATRRGELHILRCRTCGTYIHLPRPACRSCGSTDLAPERVSGRGVVHSFTVTHFPLPGFEPPFAVALIELEEQSGLRLVSNVVDTSPEELEIGIPVEVTFERISDDIVLPLFRPRAPRRGGRSAPSARGSQAAPRSRAPALRHPRPGREVAVVGVGYSQIGRDVPRTSGGLALDACRAALADAGLTKDDVDGVATYPGGYDSVPVFHVSESLGIPRLNWFEDLFGQMPAGISPVIAPAWAGAEGHRETALAHRSVKRHGPPAPGYRGTGPCGGGPPFRAPVGDA